MWRPYMWLIRLQSRLKRCQGEISFHKKAAGRSCPVHDIHVRGSGWKRQSQRPYHLH
ncbi:hypothetical protein KSP39_PZI021687 [Platanthera zijinensis]|uniref:Uncharacterized protein n=1 Tax=Platanthera zijinensis TaxID=2320716 RepID=A0AAP0AZE3_9ASPA